MCNQLYKFQYIICGGDNREVELFHIWNQKGVPVNVAGLDESDTIPRDKIATQKQWENADILILPVWGINEEGNVVSKLASSPMEIANYLNCRERKLLVLTGPIAPNLLKNVSENIRVIKTSDDQELAWINSILTAEGAILQALKVSTIAINKSFCLVLGLGRCGTSLALRLKGLGAKVIVVVRREESIALASSYNLDAISFDHLNSYLCKVEFIFNTVPAKVLNENYLVSINKNVEIIDLASSPGGVDLKASKLLQLKVHTLPGLPGKVAPQTAALNLDRVYKRIIMENLNYIEGE